MCIFTEIYIINLPRIVIKKTINLKKYLKEGSYKGLKKTQLINEPPIIEPNLKNNIGEVLLVAESLTY